MIDRFLLINQQGPPNTSVRRCCCDDGARPESRCYRHIAHGYGRDAGTRSEQLPQEHAFPILWSESTQCDTRTHPFSTILHFFRDMCQKFLGNGTGTFEILGLDPANCHTTSHSHSRQLVAVKYAGVAVHLPTKVGATTISKSPGQPTGVGYSLHPTKKVQVGEVFNASGRSFQHRRRVHQAHDRAAAHSTALTPSRPASSGRRGCRADEWRHSICKLQ